jgi:hypothetical protein
VDDKAKCQACGVKNQVMKRCTRCKAVFYCSRECQVKHWQTHKFLCGPNPQETIQDHQDDCSTVRATPAPRRAPPRHCPPPARRPPAVCRPLTAPRGPGSPGHRALTCVLVVCRTRRCRPPPPRRASRRPCAAGAASSRTGATSRTPTACCATTAGFRWPGPRPKRTSRANRCGPALAAAVRAEPRPRARASCDQTTALRARARAWFSPEAGER